MSTGIRTFPEESHSNGNDQIHSPFFPAEIRQGDPVTAWVTLRNSSSSFEGELSVWRLSPLGIELFDHSGLLTLHSEIDLKITLSKQVCEFHGLVVETLLQEHGRNIIGLRWYQKNPSTTSFRTLRKSKRWASGSQFMPSGISINPVRFNDLIHLRIKDISNSGLQLLTSLRNRFLIPGMTLEGTFSFPMSAQVQLKFQIKNVRIVSADNINYLALGVEIIHPSQKLMKVLGQFILQFGPATTLQELSEEGFFVKSVAEVVEFTSVRTSQEYQEVLELRKLAYSLAGKIKTEIEPKQMADQFDKNSRILIARYKGEIIASARLMYPNLEDLTEHELYVKLPDYFPKKDEIIEISRVCTHPNYRGSDLLIGILRHAILTSVQSHRWYLLGSSTQQLLPFYKKIGCKITSVSYSHEKLGGSEHFVFLGNLFSAITGDTVRPIMWNIVYADLIRFIRQHEILKFTARTYVRVALYRLFRPIARLFLTYSISRPKKQDSTHKRTI